ncbi:uncharacterized protein LY79DRAFT_383573 [Colletotrichum navitas]|uniref:Uncharacterized protein n=1 Tax=Colletotrichum navitas TaxID=681940 RepID=A0AAD8V9M3_9PEZI|nr:uncharacterized protein LY79DRAFT_383573 [Colletotrichum navitas]KAK1597378.1 hypothetical protein LY79DRAFT_383573 [Colletotrichum navitas]
MSHAPIFPFLQGLESPPSIHPSIPSVQRDHHQRYAHRDLSLSAPCSVQPNYYFHPLLRSIGARLHVLLPPRLTYSCDFLCYFVGAERQEPVAFFLVVVETVIRPTSSSVSVSSGPGLLHVVSFVPSQPQSPCIRRNSRYDTPTNHPNSLLLVFRQPTNPISSKSSPISAVVPSTRTDPPRKWTRTLNS